MNTKNQVGKKKLTKTSKFLSLILRHKPETIGITLDEQGWADINTLIKLSELKQNRHHVHLSSDRSTAISVGKRHGKPVVLKIQAGKMYEEDFAFFLSKNNVWLTDCVPAQYIISQ